jgi:hypothetical protein
MDLYFVVANPLNVSYIIKRGYTRYIPLFEIKTDITDLYFVVANPLNF